MSRFYHRGWPEANAFPRVGLVRRRVDFDALLVSRHADTLVHVHTHDGDFGRHQLLAVGRIGEEVAQQKHDPAEHRLHPQGAAGVAQSPDHPE